MYQTLQDENYHPVTCCCEYIALFLSITSHIRCVTFQKKIQLNAQLKALKDITGKDVQAVIFFFPQIFSKNFCLNFKTYNNHVVGTYALLLKMCD